MNSQTIFACAATILLTTSPITHTRMALNPTPLQMHCHVYYPDGLPAADATITQSCLNYDTLSVSTQTEKTDKTGQATIACAPTGFAWDQDVTYAASPTGICLFPTQNQWTGSSFVLQPFTRLRVHLTDPDGKPVGHVRVCPTVFQGINGVYWPKGLPNPWLQTTDYNGNATLSNLPQGCIMTLSVLDDYYIPSDNSTCIQLAKTTITPDVTLQTYAGCTIYGTVKYARSNKPVAGLVVTASSILAGVSAPAKTDRHGKYVIHGLARTNNMLYVNDERQTFKDWYCPTHWSVIIAPDARNAESSFTLKRRATISGIITNARTGVPSPNVDMFVSKRGYMFNNLTQTLISRPESFLRGIKADAEGHYSICLDPGEINIGPTLPKDNVFRFVQPITVKDGEHKTINFRVTAPTVPDVVHGVVLGP